MSATLQGPLLAQSATPDFIASPEFQPLEHGRDARNLLNTAYAEGQGETAAFGDWWEALRTDSEFDPHLCLCLVDQRRNELVGFAHCWTTGFLKDFAILPGRQGQGLGRFLFARTCARLAELGVRSISLKVIPSNTPAIAFYRARGLRPALS
ncbi:GNAT family N-acetyltransferase [Hyphomonas sp.]|uniref:GNAT family N-acetyltransferase n=1 Tax=Hyphomonas sp. TaxID=87 RepID=UPI002612139F|nr:GNAT family N-acetyltransferase [Hyphomonas sp.]MDF1807308.1 GNAT family N-acetyltransferase [Hyphomonas sp.]